MEEESVKERIIKVAGELFHKFGVRSVSMDDIAHHLGISKKTIYQYFADKDEIVTLGIRRFLVHEKEALREIEQRSTDPVKFLVTINRYLSRNIGDTTSSLVFELRKYHFRAWKLLEDFKSKFLFNVILSRVQEGIKCGLFRPEINPEVVSLVRLQEASLSFDQDVFPRQKFDIREVSVSLLDHFMYGITTTSGRELYQKYKLQLEEELK